MNTGFPSYAGSPWSNRHGDHSPDSGFDSAYSSTFGSTGSRLGSSQDVDIHSGSRFGEFLHGKSPSWPVTQVMASPSPGHTFPNSRSTSWHGQMKSENDVRVNSTKSFFSVTEEKCHDRASDATCLGDGTGNSWCDPVSRATHREETLSPESARKIFREATMRNERLRSNRYSTSFLHSTPEKPHKMFLHPSPSVAVSRAAGRSSIYGDGIGGCSSSSLKELNDLDSCRRRITLPRENASGYKTLNSVQGIQKPKSNDVDALSTGGGAKGQFGLMSQMCHSTGSQTDQQNNNSSHQISSTPFDQEVLSVSNGKRNNAGSVRDFNHPNCDLSKLSTPVQLQRQWSDWNRMQVRTDASPHGLIAAQSGRSKALIETLQSPAVSESLRLSHGDPDCSGDIESKPMSSSGTPVMQQIERLSLSRTSVLRKLSYEFYGQSSKHSPGLANHAILRAKRYRRFGSVDETGDEVTGDREISPLPYLMSEISPVPYSMPDGNRRQFDADFTSRSLKPCQNVNGVSPSDDFTAVGVVASASASSTTGCYHSSVPEHTSGPVDAQDVESNYPHKLKHDQRFEKKTLPVSLDDRNLAVVVPHDSPPPPDLPPRKYRESGDVKDLLGPTEDDIFDSGAVADDYAEQLRRQAKRLSHSHSSIFTSVHSPKVEQVALPGDHIRKLVDHANGESNFSQSADLIVTSINSPRVKPVFLHSGISPIASHCKVVSNGSHAISLSSSSYGSCSAALIANGCSESPAMGEVHEGVTTRKTGKTNCSRNLFDARFSGEGFASYKISSTETAKNPDQDQKSVDYVRSLSSPENQGLGPKTNASRSDERSLIVERKSYREKNSSGERNHLDREDGSALEAASLSIDVTGSMKDRTVSNKERNSLSHERNSVRQERKSANQEIKSASQERTSASQERKSISQERKSASQERISVSKDRKSASQERKSVSQEGKSANQERKTLIYKSGPKNHTSDRGRKSLNQEVGGMKCRENDSNEKRQILSQEVNSSSKKNPQHDTNKSVRSNQEKSLSHEGKIGGCERHSVMEKRRDLSDELLTVMYGNEISRTCKAKKSPEKESSGEETRSPSKAKAASQVQKITDLDCEKLQRDSTDKETEVDAKCRPACHESVKNLEKKTAAPNTGNRVFSSTSSHVDSSISHSPRCRNSDAEPRQECHFKEVIPTVKVTEAKLVISTICDVDSTVTEPFDSIIQVAPARQIKSGNPSSVGDSVVNDADQKPVATDANQKPVINDVDQKTVVNQKPVVNKKPVVTDGNRKPVINDVDQKTVVNQKPVVTDAIQTPIVNDVDRKTVVNQKAAVTDANRKPVVNNVDQKTVVNDAKQKPVVIDANRKPVSVICQNNSSGKASLLASGRCGIASVKFHSSSNPNPSQVQEKIPSFLSGILPMEHKTATYYLAQLSFNNILSENVVCETCLPAVRISIQPYLRYLTEKAAASLNSSENQESGSVPSKFKQQLPDKDELLSVLRKIDDKLKDFEQEKQSIDNEVVENVALGHKLNSLAEQKLEPKEFGKYKLYVDEMEKVLCLLLNVTKRLSSIEASIKSLPVDGAANERSVLVSKRDDLSQKFEDALALSEGTALRRHQVTGYLVKSLSDEEFKDFEHFVETKLRLFLEKQAVEDIVAIIQSKLQSLNSD